MARQAPAGLLGIHVNTPATVPPDIAKALTNSDPAPSGLSAAEKAAFDRINCWYAQGSGYAAIMGTRPQTLGYSLADSPAGLAAWFYDKFAAWTYTGGHPERELTRDEMLDDTSSARLYWESKRQQLFNAVDISIPAAVMVFPGELYRAPRSWAERAYHKLIYFHEVDKGGHFAAWNSRSCSRPRSGRRSNRCANLISRARMRGGPWATLKTRFSSFEASDYTSARRGRVLVELEGIEPSTSSTPKRRSPAELQPHAHRAGTERTGRIIPDHTDEVYAAGR